MLQAHAGRRTQYPALASFLETSRRSTIKSVTTQSATQLPMIRPRWLASRLMPGGTLYLDVSIVAIIAAYSICSNSTRPKSEPVLFTTRVSGKKERGMRADNHHHHTTQHPVLTPPIVTRSTLVCLCRRVPSLPPVQASGVKPVSSIQPQIPNRATQAAMMWRGRAQTSHSHEAPHVGSPRSDWLQKHPHCALTLTHNYSIIS